MNEENTTKTKSKWTLKRKLVVAGLILGYVGLMLFLHSGWFGKVFDRTVGVMINLNATFTAQVVNFLILLWLLNRYVYKPILGYLDQRTDQVSSQIEHAESMEQTAEEKLKNAEERLNTAMRQAKDLITRARVEGRRQRTEIIRHGEKERARLIERTRKEIERQTEQAKQELHRQTTELAITIAEQIIQRNINREDEKQFVEQALKDLENIEIG